MESNCKSKFNLDHIYCHTNDNNYIRANNSGQPDVLALLKENKHLKAMLLLHLDLIQEQSDQIMTKEKLISQLREENNSLKLRLERIERKSQLRSHKNVEILSITSVTTPSSTIITSTSSPSSSSTLSTGNVGASTVDTATTTNVVSSDTTEHYDDVDDKKENIPSIKLVEPLIVSSSIATSIHTNVNTQISSPSSTLETKLTTTTTTTTTAGTTRQQQQQQQQQNNKYKICDETFTNDSIIGESNGKLISKIVLQRVQVPMTTSTIPIDANLLRKIESQKLNIASSTRQRHHANNLPLFDKNIDIRNLSLISDHKNNILIKSEPVENNEVLDDVVIAATSTVTDEFQHSSSFIEESNEQMLDISLSSNLNQRKRKRLGFMTTRHAYCTRDWEDEQEITDETNKEEVEALKAEAPNLEIPKWTIKEFTGLYSIEGTEDLSDDVFLKRHAKLEYDEKRRKKWDVQRIREQRTIERLRRRHYKEELQQQETQENLEITTFYPTLDQLKFIQITEDLPVQAFGDSIPRIIPPVEFSLPWREQSISSPSPISKGFNSFVSVPTTGTTTSSSSQQHQSYGDSFDSSTTSFVFLKKKRRLQSQTTLQKNSKKSKKSCK